METRSILPEKLTVKINKSNKRFDVKLNEIPWMFCDVTIGNKTVWGMYDNPDKKLTDSFITETTRAAKIHGIDCVESKVIEYNSKGELNKELKYYSKVSEDALQFIANIYMDGETLIFDSIYDEDFQKSWGLEDERKYQYSQLKMVDDNTIVTELEHISCGTQVYEITLNGFTHSCLRVIQRTSDIKDILIESYIDKNGNTILFRRYNSQNFIFRNEKINWKKVYPESHIITVNDEEYIHWYDCISNKSLKIVL